MKYRVHSIRVRYDRDRPEVIKSRVMQKLGLKDDELLELKVIRRSIDARNKPPSLVYSLDLETTRPINDKDATPKGPDKSFEPAQGKESLHDSPVVVGAGPAGLFAAYLLARQGYRPLLIERGGDVESRKAALADFQRTREADPECNWLFGLGGAGTFSDGKLTTSLTHPLIGYILEALVDCGAPPQILVDAKPHIGTDVLRQVVTNLAEVITANGGAIHLGERVTGFRLTDNRISGVVTNKASYDTPKVVLATGHSARDTWAFLEQTGVKLEAKPFQMGVRVEHPQAYVDRQQFGPGAGHPALGSADYKVAARVDAIPVFSFCMCPGGMTIPTVNEAGHLCVNGMSYHARNLEHSSSGVVVTLEPEVYGGRDLESCLSFVRGVESRCYKAGGGDYTAPAQTLLGLVNNRVEPLPRSSYPFGLAPVNLTEILPDCVLNPLRKALPVFDQRMAGYLHKEAVAIAPESRASSPIRVVRDKQSRMSVSIDGLYPVGEGAGYAGGIMSAALDGLQAALKIVGKYAPMSR